MRQGSHTVSAFVLTALLAISGSASAENLQKHSGVIVSVAEDASTFVLAEVGPWEVRNGATVVMYRTIALAPATEFAIATRVTEAPSGFAGDFVEVPVGPDRVYLNDFVTVDCRHVGARMIALKIVVAPGGDDHGTAR